MKVIVYLNDPKDMGHAQVVLENALEDAELGSCGFLHQDGRSSCYQRLKSGTVVIQVLPKKEKVAA